MSTIEDLKKLAEDAEEKAREARAEYNAEVLNPDKRVRDEAANNG
jgi:hypothetical protein